MLTSISCPPSVGENAPFHSSSVNERVFVSQVKSPRHLSETRVSAARTSESPSAQPASRALAKSVSTVREFACLQQLESKWGPVEETLVDHFVRRRCGPFLSRAADRIQCSQRGRL